MGAVASTEAANGTKAIDSIENDGKPSPLRIGAVLVPSQISRDRMELPSFSD